MKFNRSSGIILHPSSLPGPDGIGDLGPEAYRWINLLEETGTQLWQVLPLGPTGYGDSPYQCFSAFAGNPYLVSPTLLQEEGLLKRTDFTDRPEFPDEKVAYGEVIKWKLTILDRAYAQFRNSPKPAFMADYVQFKADNTFWLPDFALFMAIKEANGGVSWEHWPKPLRKRDSKVLEAFSKAEADVVERHTFRQFLFYRQWLALKEYANKKGIKIIGDIPIFVAYDSADAWANSDLFYLDADGIPAVVAGVPPDYFSPTGQLWGNPLYKWAVHHKSGYAWWIERMKATLKLVDIVRLDHFRGFAGYWEVTYGNLTAEIGRWVRGPGAPLFEALRQALGDLPIIAEDLGVITPDVIALREQFSLPGMRIFQFAFSNGPADPFLPHNYIEHCVAYTGTHDNDTALGWYLSAPAVEQDFIRRYLARSGEDLSWDMIRAVWSSVAGFALAPLQDMLSLGTEARMNFPGKASGNWSWRFLPGAVSPNLVEKIKEFNHLFYRSPEKSKTSADVFSDYKLEDA